MTRKPRSKEDHLVTLKLFLQGYGLKGFINYFTCQLGFFIVFDDFGFQPFNLLYKNGLTIYPHNDSDVYNPTDPHFGNTKLAGITDCANFGKGDMAGQLVDWLYAKQSGWDLRMSALLCNMVTGSAVFTPSLTMT